MKAGLILKRILFFIVFGTIFSFGAVWDITTPNSDVTKTENSIGNISFTVTLKATSTSKCTKNETYTVNYSAVDGTAALADNDYESPTGTGSISIKYAGTTKISGTCGTPFNFTVAINGDTKFEGDEAFFVQLSNPSSNASVGVGTRTINITNDDAATSVTSPFSLRYKQNLKGNMKIIGNTVLQAPDNGNSNSEVDLRYTKLASDGSNASIFNSSSATLLDTIITTPTAAKVKWAGLYWSGYLHTYDANDGTQTQYTGLTSNAASIDNVIQNHTVKFRVGSTSYDISNHTVLGEILFANTGSYAAYSYGCFADVTNLMQGADPRGTYSVANIPSMEGATARISYRDTKYGPVKIGIPTTTYYPVSGTWDGLGNSGAWTLVVIYENTSVGEKTRNATVFDGFVKVEDGSPQTINVSGFKTPKSGNVDSTLSVFANEGDRYITGDKFIFKNLDGDKINQTVTLSSSGDTNNYFNSSITGVDTRTPNLTNNNGIDIHTDQMGAGGYDVVSTNQTKASITLNSTGDVYYPVMVSFATELYMPELCYDVSATIDGEYMQKDSWDRSFIPHQHKGSLTNKVFIRNLEGDFRYIKSSLKANWTYIAQAGDSGPTPTIAYVEGSEKVQNPGVYAYTKPKLTQETGRFYIGNEENPIYGIIKPYESLYAISSHNVNDVYGKTIQVDIDVNASLNLDPSDTTSLTSYRYKTSDGTLKMCKGELSYSPKWYQFNVESPGAQKGDYRLFTQVTGTDYNLNVVSYTKDTNSQYTTKTSFNGAMEVELFEVPSFQSLGVYDSIKYDFDRICEDSNSSKPWSDGLHFSRFKNTTSTSLGIDTKDNRFAMQNAGLRLWVLMADYDGDGVKTDITKYNYCENVNDGDSDGSCFKNLWKNDTYYKTQTTCSVPCSKTDKDCYQCLKENYSQPICSRDNFSVRPYAVQVEALNNAYDGSGNLITTKSIQKNNKASTDIHNLISGDDISYKATYEAKSAPDPVSKTYSTPAGYFFKIYATEAMNEANGAFGDLVRFFGLKFDNDKTNSKDYTKCDDSTHKRFKLGTKGYEVKNDNVGNYDVVLVDKDWTLVDQATYLHKPVFDYNGKKRVDDCNPNNTLTNNSGLQGCDTQSFEANEDVNFYEIPVKFLPDQIDVSTLAQKSVLNDGTSMGRLWTYINNLNDTQDMAAALQGSLKAQNAKDTTTSNFTAGCFAQNVRLFARYTSPEVTYNDTTSKIQATASSETNLQYVQNFNNIPSSSTEIQTEHFVTDAVVAKNDSSENVQTDGINTDKEINIIVLKDNFLDSNKGTLAYDLRMNFNKVIAAAVSPIHILFVKITSLLTDEEVVTTASYPTAYRLGCDKDDYICLKAKNPDKLFEIADNSQLYTKNSTIDATVDREAEAFKFLYGRVYTDLETFGSNGKSVTGNTASTTFDALVYSNAAPDGSLKDILDTVAVDSSWYRAKTHSAFIDKDGQIDNLAVYSKTTGDPSISPSSTSILFDDLTAKGRTSSVTFDNSGNTKPNKVTFQINPSIWLRYKTATSSSLGEPRFTINFIENGYNWVGKGKTGNVVKQVPQGATKNRLNW